MTAEPHSFHDLPASAYPMRMVAWRADNYEIVWRETVREPGAVQIPPLAKQHGVAIGVAIFYADGGMAIQSPETP
jgi:hypothetical protein